MKRFLLSLAVVTLLSSTPAIAQPGSSATVQVTANPPAPQPLTKFNLDFPGGTPAQLVAAIETASGKPLNAIIPPEDASTSLPPMKLSNVDAAQLFQALFQATHKTVYRKAAGGSPYSLAYDAGFQTEGKPNDASIWCFFVNQPPAEPRPPELVQFFPVAPLIERGVTLDDLTTAIETAWKMQGRSSGAALRFHKETNILIAVGTPEDIEAIHSAVNALMDARPREVHTDPKTPAVKNP